MLEYFTVYMLSSSSLHSYYVDDWLTKDQSIFNMVLSRKLTLMFDVKQNGYFSEGQWKRGLWFCRNPPPPRGAAAKVKSTSVTIKTSMSENPLYVPLVLH